MWQPAPSSGGRFNCQRRKRPKRRRRFADGQRQVLIALSISFWGSWWLKSLGRQSERDRLRNELSRVENVNRSSRNELDGKRKTVGGVLYVVDRRLWEPDRMAECQLVSFAFMFLSICTLAVSLSIIIQLAYQSFMVSIDKSPAPLIIQWFLSNYGWWQVRIRRRIKRWWQSFVVVWPANGILFLEKQNFGPQPLPFNLDDSTDIPFIEMHSVIILATQPTITHSDYGSSAFSIPWIPQNLEGNECFEFASFPLYFFLTRLPSQEINKSNVLVIERVISWRRRTRRWKISTDVLEGNLFSFGREMPVKRKRWFKVFLRVFLVLFENRSSECVRLWRRRRATGGLSFSFQNDSVLMDRSHVLVSGAIALRYLFILGVPWLLFFSSSSPGLSTCRHGQESFLLPFFCDILWRNLIEFLSNCWMNSLPLANKTRHLLGWLNLGTFFIFSCSIRTGHIPQMILDILFLFSPTSLLFHSPCARVFQVGGAWQTSFALAVFDQGTNQHFQPLPTFGIRVASLSRYAIIPSRHLYSFHLLYTGPFRPCSYFVIRF